MEYFANKYYSLGEDYEPDDLVNVDIKILLWRT